jgi:6-hydroxytryprostatin B O-methyltransferase
MRFIVSYRVPAHIPFGTDIHVGTLADACGLHAEVLLRVLRYCVTNGVFRETKPSCFAHTAASASLARGPLSVAMRWSVEIPALSALRMAESARDCAPCDDPRRCGFSLEYQTDQTYYEYQEAHPELARMFSDNMATESGTMRLSPKHAVRGFRWDKLGVATVVDVSNPNPPESLDTRRWRPTLTYC